MLLERLHDAPAEAAAHRIDFVFFHRETHFCWHLLIYDLHSERSGHRELELGLIQLYYLLLLRRSSYLYIFSFRLLQ